MQHKVHKIVVIGPEATGKSTLCDALAKELNTIWVPEYARGYIDDLPRPYEEHDLLTIAQGQIALEEKMIALAGQHLICDTDLYVMKVWSEHRYNRVHPWILEQIANRKYDLYLLTYPDIPWEADPQREYPELAMREYFYNIYRDIVQNSGVSWVDIRGAHEHRLETALTAIGRMA